MGLISFARITSPVASITFASNPSVRKFGGTEDYYQITNLSAGGDIYVYDYTLESTQILRFSWDGISYNNFIAILNFYETMQKTMYSFTFTDFDATTATARFISSLQFTYISSNLLTLSFDILIDEDRAY